MGKGLNVEGDNSDGSWVSQSIGESNMTAEEWLLKNFGEDVPLLKNFGEDVPPAALPTRAPTRLSTNNPTKKLAKDPTEESLAEFPANLLPIRIPIERCYDTQWNPPGHPLLNAYFLSAPYNDRQSGQRDGYYTFDTTTEGKISSFVRVNNES